MAAFHEIIERINIIERMRCAFSQSEPSNFGSYAFRTSAKYLFDKRWNVRCFVEFYTIHDSWKWNNTTGEIAVVMEMTSAV